MEMTPEKIASEYRQAANKQKQIKILAELNLCKQREIVQILLDLGEPIPSVWHEKLQRPERESASVKRKAKAAADDANVGAIHESPAETADTSSGLRPPSPQGEGIGGPPRASAPTAQMATVRVTATLDEIRREAFRLMAEARALGAEQYFVYSAGVMDLVTRITGEDGG